MICHIDIETFSCADLSSVGVFKYAEHPSTEILCIAWAIDNEPVQLWHPALGPDGLKPLIKTFAHPAVKLTAHNAQFERTLLNSAAGRLIGLPQTLVNQWYCTAAKAAAVSLPRSLAGCSAALGLLTKDEAGKRVMLKLSRPRKPTKLDTTTRYTPNTAPEDFKILYNYCSNDVAVEREIDKALPNLSTDEQNVFWWDMEVNRRGIAVDLKATKAVIEMAAQFTERETEKCIALTGARPSQRAVIMNWCKEHGYELPGYTANDITAALQDSACPATVKQIIGIRRETSRTSVKKFNAIQNAACADSRIRGMFLYHGAGTGRWTGRLVQLQNLPRGRFKNTDELAEVIAAGNLDEVEMLYGSAMDAFSTAVRPMLVAKEGAQFVCADFSNIEGRVLAWLAGEEWKLEAFRAYDNKTGPDLYLVTAAEMFNVPIEKAKEYRQLGKVAELSLGYQGGVAAFTRMGEVYGITVPDAKAKQILQAWRKANPAIQQLWAEVEAAAVNAVHTGKVVQCANNRVAFAVRGNFLFMKLPSGRKIAYPYPKLKPGKFEGTVQLAFMGDDGFSWKQETTYGGSLVNNLVQATARDLLVNGAMQVEAAGYPVVGHVHDELIAEMTEGSVEDFAKQMTRLPSWAQGCPVSAEGWAGSRYKK